MIPVTVLLRTLRAIFWVALALGIAAMSLGLRRVDLWWQLPDGLAILRTHHLPAGPTTAFGLPAVPYLDEYSLYEIGLAALFKLGGLGAIHAAFVAVYLLIFALPFAAAFRAPRDLVSGALVALAAIFVINRFEQRPEIVGVLLLVILIRLLLRTREIESGFLLRLALLMAVWTNVHSSYLIGLLALAFWLVQRISVRDASARWSVTASVATLAVAAASALINPYGIERVAFTFAQQTDLGSNLLSPEMWPAWDQPEGVQRTMALAVVLLGLTLISHQRSPWWLGALALALLGLTLFNIRHMSFLAGVLLYLAAHRRVIDSGPRWNRALVPLLTAACIGALLFDAVAVRGTVFNLRAAPLPDVQRFAPALAAIAQSDSGSTVLCHDATGSYLTFASPNLRPYMDSGQGRFDDATKRLYFFAVYDAASFDRTLDHLTHLDSVLVTAQVEVWTLSMIGRPGWYLAAGDDNGLLFRRSADPAAAFVGNDRRAGAALARSRDRAIAANDWVHAFCFSALIDPPAQSLSLLDRSSSSAWTERLYSFTRAWLQRQAAGEVEAFFSAHPHLSNPLLAELLLDRQTADSPLLPMGQSDLAQLARVGTLLDRQQLVAATSTFRAMKKPLTSALYYTLRGELNPAANRTATAAERWQDANDGGPAWIDQTCSQLDARAAALESPFPR